MTKKSSFLSNRIRSIVHAAKGAYQLITTESSLKVQFFIGVLMTLAGLYFDLSTTEWIIQIIAIFMIMALEGLNTAIEELADFIQPEQHERIGLIKDLAAGAVFIFAVGAVIIGCIMYIPKIF
jgi:diacylglycerol kinase (ATP)